jgi:hypothetical protein
MGLFDFLNQPGVLTGINQGIQQLRLEDNNKFEKYLDKAVNYVETQALPLINESKKILASEVRVAKNLSNMGVNDNVIKAIASTGRGALAEFYSSVMKVNAKYGATQKQITGEDINEAVKGAELFKDDNQTILDFMTKTYLPNVEAGMDKASAFDISGVRGRAYKELDDYAGTVLADGTSLTYKDLYTLIKGGAYTGFNYMDDRGVSIDQTILQQSFKDPLSERLYDAYQNSVMNKIQSYGASPDKAVELLEADNSDMGLLLNEYATRMFPNQKDAFITQNYSEIDRGQTAVTGASTNLYVGFNDLIASNNERTPFSSEAVAKAWAKVIGTYTQYDKPIFFIKTDGSVGVATVSQLLKPKADAE